MTSTQSLTEDSRAVIECVYAAVKAGDVERLFDYFADDIVLHEPPFLPFGQAYHGKDGFLELLPRISQYLDVSQVEVNYLVADQDRVVGCITMPDRSTGELAQMLELFTLRDSKVMCIQLFYFDAGTMVTRRGSDG